MKTSRLYGALFCLLNLCISPAHAAGTWATTLQARDFDGNTSTIEGYYDTVLEITWLANANLAASNSFGLAYNTDLGDYPGDPYGPSYTEHILTSGRMNWGGALHWIDAMNNANYLGYNGWRLPTIQDTGALGCNFAYTGTDCGYNVQTGSAAATVYSEMASMFYDTLGNLAYYDTSGTGPQNGWGLSSTGPFANVQAAYYWSGSKDASFTSYAWDFRFSRGYQDAYYKYDELYGWAVHSGDVGTAIVSAPLADGDVNGDDQVNLADLLLAMRILNGQYTPTQAEQDRWDVAPLVNGVPQPDSQNTTGDYVVLLQKVSGQINF